MRYRFVLNLQKCKEQQFMFLFRQWLCWRRHTGCSRRNGPDFGRVFLRSYYTDITQNTYIQSSMVTKILAREVWNFDSYYSLITKYIL